MLVISVPFGGVYGIALGTVISTAFSAIVNMYPNRKLLDYTYTEQFLDVFPSLIISSLMGIFVYAIGFFETGRKPNTNVTDHNRNWQLHYSI